MYRCCSAKRHSHMRSLIDSAMSRDETSGKQKAPAKLYNSSAESWPENEAHRDDEGVGNSETDMTELVKEAFCPPDS